MHDRVTLAPFTNSIELKHALRSLPSYNQAPIELLAVFRWGGLVDKQLWSFMEPISLLRLDPKTGF